MLTIKREASTVVKSRNIKKKDRKNLQLTPVPTTRNVVCRDGSTVWTPDEIRLIKTITAKLETVFGQGFLAQACFWNAQMATVLSGGEAVYCEGVLDSKSIVCRHAWCLINGKVWDMSLPLTCAKLNKEFPSDAIYIGRTFSFKDVIIDKFNKSLPILG